VDQTEVAKTLQQQLDAIQGSGQADAAKGQFPELNQPHLVLASAAGIAATTAGSIHLQAGEHIAVTSEGHISLSVGKRLLASAKDGIRLFALNGGMKWIAGKGKITIEAHKDKINLTAKQKVTIKSTTESIFISAPTKVVVNGGGSFTEWSNAGILHGTLGTWIEHAAKHVSSSTRTPASCSACGPC
jgi:type VI secretion system secreted protein VgrG